jgi:cytochrome c-type biogenesis protein CcmH/NrfG
MREEAVTPCWRLTPATCLRRDYILVRNVIQYPNVKCDTHITHRHNIMKHVHSVFFICVIAEIIRSSTVMGQVPDQNNRARTVFWPSAPAPTPWPSASAMAPIDSDLDSSLPEPLAPSGTDQPGPGTVTVRALEHKIPGKAMKEFTHATKERLKGNHQSAIEHLKTAVAIDPEFLAAWNDLGANYMSLNQSDLAIAPFEKVIEIDPHEPLGYANLGAAYLVQNEPAAAERAAREEIKLDRKGTRGNLILGSALVLQEKCTPEAEHNLERALPEFPRARMMLALWLALNGAIDRAEEELRQYIAIAEPDGASLAQQWLERLDLASQSGVPFKVRITD